MLGVARAKDAEDTHSREVGKHRETIHLWIKGIERYGLLGFLNRHDQAKKGERRSRQVDPL